MEPKRGVLLRHVSVGEPALGPDTAVWMWSETESEVEVEYRGRRFRVPRDAVVATPVPAPTLEALRALDPCFGLKTEAFVAEHEDQGRMFTILRCAHGRRFLRDVRGTIGLYERLTLLEETDPSQASEVWSRYHVASDDWLNLLGRTL